MTPFSLRAVRALAAGFALALALVLPACAPKVEAPRVDDSDYIFPEFKRGAQAASVEGSFMISHRRIVPGRFRVAGQDQTAVPGGYHL